MESTLAAAEVIQSGPGLIAAYVQLRTDCHRAGHPLAQKVHDADRWVAATALLVEHEILGWGQRSNGRGRLRAAPVGGGG